MLLLKQYVKKPCNNSCHMGSVCWKTNDEARGGPVAKIVLLSAAFRSMTYNILEAQNFFFGS